MAGFRKGALGSPFQTEYQGNQGMDMGEGGKASERGPKIGSGALGKRVTMEVSRSDDAKSGKSGRK